jgi:uncharacterized protein GlcG (DUF336 family)
VSEFQKAWHNITLAGAKRVRDCALLKASDLGVPVSVVVVDRTGVILVMETSDLTAPGASEASIMKAKAPARYRIATHTTAELVKTLPAQLAQHALSLPEICAFHGGVPIQIEGEGRSRSGCIRRFRRTRYCDFASWCGSVK